MAGYDSGTRRGRHRRAIWVSLVTCAVLIICAAIPVVVSKRTPASVSPTQSIRYLGLYQRDMATSYAGVAAFTANTGVQPDLLTYYSSWLESFQASFAATAAEYGALPLVQINPEGVDIGAIADGQYDSYLISYAEAVRAYQGRVVLSFGHEMNGGWYSWGNGHTSPKVFVDAWQHIVTLFRGLGVRNVTWMWTPNIIQTGGIPPPTDWWPGNSYVNWVGIDGYYYEPSWTFASLFGPTITAVRELTGDPILIAETGASAGASQPAKIADLFAGVRLYGLLGFVWFDAKADEDWQLSSRAAFGAFRRGARYYRPQP